MWLSVFTSYSCGECIPEFAIVVIVRLHELYMCINLEFFFFEGGHLKYSQHCWCYATQFVLVHCITCKYGDAWPHAVLSVPCNYIVVVCIHVQCITKL